MSKRAVFLDRDGVLIENVPTYVRHMDEVHVFEFTQAALSALHEAGFLLFVVTNQAIVGRGIMELDAIQSLHAEIMTLVDPHQFVTQSYLCPHSPDENCECRKPNPGSLLKAAMEFDVDLAASYMVGDAVTDVDAGLNAGVTPIMVLTGRGSKERELLEARTPIIVANLQEAVTAILAL